MKHLLFAATIRLAAKNAHPESADGQFWLVLFRVGMNELEGHGPYLVDEQAFALVAAEFTRRGLDLVCDYEHQTLEGAEAPAAGWIKELQWDSVRGILARVEWTEKGAAYVASGEYRYFSPVFYVRKTDNRLFGLHSMALTNTPRHNHLQPILAKLGAHAPQSQPMEGSMDFLKKLAAKLGLSDAATEDEVMTAVAKLQSGPGVPKDVLDALNLEQADASTVVASIHALRQQSKGMVSAADFEALKARLAARDAEEVVAKALTEGKITPDQKDWAEKYAATDLDGFRTFVAKAPVVVPVRKLPDSSGIQADAELDSATMLVAGMMGVSKDDLKTYGGSK